MRQFKERTIRDDLRINPGDLSLYDQNDKKTINRKKQN